MNEATYEFTADPPRRLMRLTVKGFWDATTAEAFERDFRKTARSLNCPADRYRIIVDARAYDLPSQDLSARFQKIAGDPTLRARYSAVITHSALLKMQVSRGLDDSIRCFSTEDDALAWLSSLDLD